MRSCDRRSLLTPGVETPRFYKRSQQRRDPAPLFFFFNVCMSVFVCKGKAKNNRKKQSAGDSWESNMQQMINTVSDLSRSMKTPLMRSSAIFSGN